MNRLRTGEAQSQALLRDRTTDLTALRSSQSVSQREQQALLEAQRLELESTRNLVHDKQTELKLTQVQLHQLQDKVRHFACNCLYISIKYLAQRKRADDFGSKSDITGSWYLIIIKISTSGDDLFRYSNRYSRAKD